MKIKSNDKIKVLAGKDKGKTGKVLQVLDTGKKIRVVVEGINLLIKHQKPRKQGEKGERIQFPAPLDISNVAFICSKCNKTSRVSFKITKLNTDSDDTSGAKKKRQVKNRVCRKCQEVI